MDNKAIMDSILNSIKKLCGISEEDDSFDVDIIIHINSALMILNEIGIGPDGGYYIESADETWDQYVPDNRFISKAIQSFVYIKVKLVFDPPASPTVVDALTSSADEYASRIRDWAERQ